MIPAHVLDAIATRTGIDPRGIGRSARWGACTRCNAPVLRGLDADMCAFQAEADPQPLTPIGEILALAGGRATYLLDGKPPALSFRDRHRIRTFPAAQFTVLPEHQCGAPALPTKPSAPAPAERTAGDRPPY